MRDISEATLRKRLKELGATTVGFMGYWHLGNVGISRFNYDTRRDFLAELVRIHNEHNTNKKEV